MKDRFSKSKKHGHEHATQTHDKSIFKKCRTQYGGNKAKLYTLYVSYTKILVHIESARAIIFNGLP